VILLYTDEDIHVASYVRTHFDSLEKASGSDCDVLFIENPRSIERSIYWRGILDEVSYIIWKSLGWEASKPYNKAEAYDLAKTFMVPIDILPCALVFVNGKLLYDSISRLEGDLTTTFRQIFIGFQKNVGHDEPGFLNRLFHFRRKTAITSQNNMADDKMAQRPLCFLSHNSNDKNVVRRVAASLHTFSIDTWFDEWEILPGDSIAGKVAEGLRKASHLIVFLSKAAVSSNWVIEEMNTALYHAISSKQLAIIPVAIEDCDIPMIIGSYAHIKEDDPRAIATNIRQAVLGVTTKPPVQIPAL